MVVGGTAATYGHSLDCNSSDNVQLALVRNIGDIPVAYSPSLVELDDTIRNSLTLSSAEVQQVLVDIANTPKESLPDFWHKLPSKFKQHKFICAAWTTKGSVEDKTFRRYLNAVEEMVAFWRSEEFCHKNATVFEALNSINQTVAFSNFLIAKCYDANKLAGGTITRFKYSLIKILSFYGVPLRLDKELTKNVIKTCCQFWGKEAKPTAAIPRKILRQLFEYLRATDEHMFTFIAFVFFTAMRISEALKLSYKDFKFFTNSEGRPSVSLRLRHTKTNKKYSDSGHTIIFTKLNVKTDLDPFILAQKLFEFAKASEGDTIVPFSGTFSSRAKALYSWFRTMKSDFHHWNLKTNSVDYDTSTWRFHSLRTTFVGIMRQLGMSWEQLQLRTGHAWDSACTKDTYFMNALMSQEFDQTFEKMLDQNLQAQELFVLAGGTNSELQKMRAQTKQFRTDFESVLSEGLNPHELFSLTGGVDEENLSTQDQEKFLQEENFEATFDNPFLTTVQQWSDSSSLRKKTNRKRKRKGSLSLGPHDIFSSVPKQKVVKRILGFSPSFLKTPTPPRCSASVGPVLRETVHKLTLSSDKHLPKKASASLSSRSPSVPRIKISKEISEIEKLEKLLPSQTFDPFSNLTQFTPVQNCLKSTGSSFSPLKYRKIQKASTPVKKRRRSASLSNHLDNEVLLRVPNLTDVLRKAKGQKQKVGQEIYHPSRNSIKRAENFFLSDFPKASRSRSFSPRISFPWDNTTTTIERKPKVGKKF